MAKQLNKNIQRHPLSAIFEDTEGESFDDLKQSLIDEGAVLPITITKDGRVLDGWQRWRAIQALAEDGYDIPYTVTQVDKNFMSRVIALNIERRNITPLERAQAIIAMDDWNQKENGAKPTSRAQLAREAGVGEGTIQRARDKGKMERIQEAIDRERIEHQETARKLEEAEQRIEFMRELNEGIPEGKLGVLKRIKKQIATIDTQLQRSKLELQRCRQHGRILYREKEGIKKQLAHG